MKGLKLSAKTQDEVVEYVQKVAVPAGRLVKSLRKIALGEDSYLPTGELNTDFEKAMSFKLSDPVERPDVAVEHALSRPKAVILDHRMSRTISADTSVRLSSKNASANSRTISADSWKKFRSASVVSAKLQFIDHAKKSSSQVNIGNIEHSIKSHTYQIEPMQLLVNGQLVQKSLTANNYAEIVRPKVFKSTLDTLVRHRQNALTESFFDHEKRLLADSSGVDIRQVKWIGLFRYVPIGAISSLVVDDARGRLVLKMKDNASQIAASKMQVTVDIAMGRHTGSGALLQVIVSK